MPIKLEKWNPSAVKFPRPVFHPATVVGGKKPKPVNKKIRKPSPGRVLTRRG
jgi:hypothetical protein